MGVLNREQIHAYYDKGLTRDDIITANRLCRLGKNTITEILDKKVSGTAWAEIIEENYSKSTKKQKTNPNKRKKSSEKTIYTNTKWYRNIRRILLSRKNRKRTSMSI